MPQEDIGTVLDRFHKWAGQSTEPVRELTYEEAVARSRRRVYADEDVFSPEESTTPTAAPTARSAAGTKPLTPKLKSARSKQAGPKSPNPKQATKGKSKMKTAAKPAGAAHKKAAPPSARKASTRPAPASTIETAAPPTDAYQAVLLAASEIISMPAPAKPAKTTTAAYQSVLQATGQIISISESSAPPTTAAPSFQQALAAHISRPFAFPHHAAAPLALKADTRAVAPLAASAAAVHLTVRLSNGERDSVRERAHDLGITPTDYIRHYILEIDSLRAELESARLVCARATVAADATPSSGSFSLEANSSLGIYRAALPSRPADGAWLTRLIHFVLPGKAKGQKLSTSA